MPKQWVKHTVEISELETSELNGYKSDLPENFFLIVRVWMLLDHTNK